MPPVAAADLPAGLLARFAGTALESMHGWCASAHNRCLPNSEKLWPYATEGAQLGEI